MADVRPHQAARPIAIARRPVYGWLLPVPIVCFVGALVTDLAYQGSGGNLLWVNFSSWMMAAGLLIGALAALFALIDAIRGVGVLWGFLLLVAAWIVELINSFIHARDGWTAVVPDGLVLSIVGVVLIVVAGWLLRPAYEVRP
jgi:uncharacterized membrane protein